MGNPSSSRRPSSPLTELFAQRCGFSAESPEKAIRHLAGGLSGATREGSDLGALLPLRNIDPFVEVTDKLPGDGIIEPKGRSYSEGFRMCLKRGQADRRLRFTMAHEVCHTFFYEIVPEIKFRPHVTDPAEEWLCNVGAGELLIPLSRLRDELATMSESMSTLERLAETFNVSAFAMLLRLRQAGLWDRELAYWHRMSDGRFVLDTKAGNRRSEWTFDPSVLRRVWDRDGKSESGATFVYVEKSGESGVTRVYYQAQKRGSTIMTLTGRRKFNNREKKPPLLRARAPLRTKSCPAKL